MATAPMKGMIVPNPQAPRTLGILCIVFSSLILLGDTCTAFSTAYSPLIGRLAEIYLRNMQSQIDAQFDAEAKAFDRREAAAKTEEEKAQIRADRDRFNAGPRPMVNTINSRQFDQFRDPVFQAVTWGQLVSGAILNVLMLAGGIGLMQLSSRWRKITLWMAGFKVARLVVLLVLGIAVVMPRATAAQREQFKAITERQAAAGGNVAGPNAQQLSMIAAISTYGSLLGYYLVAPIFPVVLLIALNRPRVRAAFVAAKLGREQGDLSW